MSTFESALSVNVDITNPGQFFACCGLLELGHRLNHGAVGWFDVGRFHVGNVPDDLVEQFLMCKAEPIPDDLEDVDLAEDADTSDSDDGKVVPIALAEPFCLRLDWWRSREAEQAKLKTWSAGQKVIDLLNGKTTIKATKKGHRTTYSPGMRDHFKASLLKNPDDWLRAAEPIKSPKSFSFDSRLSRNNALDLGSVDAKTTIAFSPAVDVLALIGLQRFRPQPVERWTRNRYCAWRERLPAEIAAVVTLGAIPQLIDGCFEFPIKPRDAKGRYKLFGHAHSVRRNHV